MGSFAKEALKLFYQKFGRRIIKTAAESKWMANTIRLLKQKAHKPKTSDVAKRVREKMLKDKPFEGFTPKIVPKKPNILGDALKTGKHIKVPTPKGLKPPGLKKSNVIPFPKKPPHLKADGGRIDKALPGRSRDI
tara:strand:- start:80 stop:484 length:405 start_codon:yes stop_codon:yes gene_type:complete